jgi:hypothetical protein
MASSKSLAAKAVLPSLMERKKQETKVRDISQWSKVIYIYLDIHVSALTL